MPKPDRKKPLRHHIVYNNKEGQEIVVPVYPGEHWLCTQLQRRGSLISKGFLKHLEFFIWRHRDTAQDLTEEMRTYDTKNANGAKKGGKK